MAKVNGAVAAFLIKTYDMVDDFSTNSVVSWSHNNNNSFVVWNVMEFATHILPNYFKHNNFSSFVRQLNTYGFRKVDPNRWEFANEGFVRGQKQLLKSISRRKSPHVNGNSQQPSQAENAPAWACVEVGKFGFEEQVERLKRDKNVIMQEIVRLRQQQQTTDNQLQTVGKRVQVMEQRQQQMMSFLGKAVHSPGFLAQFVQPQNEGNRHITEDNKKRRFHRQEGDSLATKNHHIALDGRVVKYQPSINEAAKALFFQILQMNNSTRTESSVKNPDAFLIDDVLSATELDSCSSSTQVSGVTLSEVLPTSGGSYMAVESQFPVNGMTNCTNEVQSSPSVLTDCVKAAGNPKLTARNCQSNARDFGELQVIGTQSSFMNSGPNFVGPDTGNAENIDMMSTVLDGTLAVEADAISPNAKGKSKLPGINDDFWELFLTSNPSTGDTDEVICSSQGYGVTEDYELSSGKEIQQEKMDKKQHIDHIIHQMRLKEETLKS